MRFAQEAWPIVLPIVTVAVVAGVLAGRWGSWGLGWSAVFFAVLGISIALFFRNPTRTPPAGDSIVVSPADGRVIVTDTLSDGTKRIAIFLSVFDVHVNRVPITCDILEVISKPGKYLHAGSDEASKGNARIDVRAMSRFGPVGWSQISGLIARKISCRLKAGDHASLGEEYGLIYFGSRMEILLPSSAAVVCKVGDRAAAGESILARFDQ